MSYTDDADFKNKFMFPDSYPGDDRLTDARLQHRV